jgi:hypothetical protein
VNGSGHDRTTPSVEDGDGVRVIRERRSVIPAAMVLKALAATVVVAGIAMLVFSSRSSRIVAGPDDSADTAPAVSATAGSPIAGSGRVTATAARVPQRHAAAPVLQRHSGAPDLLVTRNPDDLPSGDPDDIATYVSPGDPVPTMSEVIQALHDLGDHSGIGAFNPPGTSPPLRGLAVPEDFELPAGYVRHHQVTDEGEPLEPILMFSPDGVFVDAAGREIAIPPDRVVPPALAPPGLPVREITIPPTP